MLNIWFCINCIILYKTFHKELKFLFIFSSFVLKRQNEKRSAIAKSQRFADLAPAHAKKKWNQKRRKDWLD